MSGVQKIAMQPPAKRDMYKQHTKRVALGPKPVNLPTPSAPTTVKKRAPLPSGLHKPLRPRSKNGSVATKTSTTLRNPEDVQGYGYTLEPCTMKPYNMTETARNGKGMASRNISYTRIAQPPKYCIAPIAKDAKTLEKEALFNDMIAKGQAEKEKEKAKQQQQQQQQQPRPAAVPEVPMSKKELRKEAAMLGKLYRASR